MLTPKSPPRDFRVASDSRSAKKRLCRQSGAVRERKCAGTGPKKGGSVKRFFSCYNNDLAWLCWQSLAKGSLGSNSLLSGKIQGILPDLAAKAKKRIGFPTISQLLTAKFPPHPNREFSGANRELFPAEQGIIQLINADGVFGTHTLCALTAARHPDINRRYPSGIQSRNNRCGFPVPRCQSFQS